MNRLSRTEAGAAAPPDTAITKLEAGSGGVKAAFIRPPRQKRCEFIPREYARCDLVQGKIAHAAMTASSPFPRPGERPDAEAAAKRLARTGSAEPSAPKTTCVSIAAPHAAFVCLNHPDHPQPPRSSDESSACSTS
ncbi:hypothetical protein HED48_22485 [Ochrobactrum intermedium]|nr:hypothetical protein [Brucella intermedia]